MATQLSVLLAVSFLSWSGDEAPQPDVERTARLFRIHTYNSFRLDRGEYDRRVKASSEVELRWNAFLEQNEDHDPTAFLQWYADAQELSKSDPLPELPEGPPVAAPERKEVTVSAPRLEAPNFLAPQVKPIAQPQTEANVEPQVEPQPVVEPAVDEVKLELLPLQLLLDGDLFLCFLSLVFGLFGFLHSLAFLYVELGS